MEVSKELLVAFSALLAESESLHNNLEGFADSAQMRDLEKAIDVVNESLCRTCRSGDRDTKRCWRCEAHDRVR